MELEPHQEPLKCEGQTWPEVGVVVRALRPSGCEQHAFGLLSPIVGVVDVDQSASPNLGKNRLDAMCSARTVNQSEVERSVGQIGDIRVASTVFRTKAKVNVGPASGVKQRAQFAVPLGIGLYADDRCCSLGEPDGRHAGAELQHSRIFRQRTVDVTHRAVGQPGHGSTSIQPNAEHPIEARDWKVPQAANSDGVAPLIVEPGLLRRVATNEYAQCPAQHVSQLTERAAWAKRGV